MKVSVLGLFSLTISPASASAWSLSMYSKKSSAGRWTFRTLARTLAPRKECTSPA
ncbi:MAG TPA: hypothetical protein VML35_00365 [Gaiellaceae bacterium]|nr:hypothetical protein [Gaiellaceae bacterium]